MKNGDELGADLRALMRLCKGLDVLADHLQPEAAKSMASPTAGSPGKLGGTPGSRGAPPAAANRPRMYKRSTLCAKLRSGIGTLRDLAPSAAVVTSKAKSPAKSPSFGGSGSIVNGKVSGGKPDTGGGGLLAMLARTQLHFVRCIKPNEKMAPFGFEQESPRHSFSHVLLPASMPHHTCSHRFVCAFEQPRVLEQLSYSGLLEMVRILRQGFPSRMCFAAFVCRFGQLQAQTGRVHQVEASGDGSSVDASGDRRTGRSHPVAAAAQCRRILGMARLEEGLHYRLGRSLVFLRNGVEATLHEAAHGKHRRIISLQARRLASLP